MNAMWFGLMLIAAGSFVYLINYAVKPAGWARAEAETELAA